MAGITAFGAYIPYYRLTHKDIARAWGGRAGDPKRAVAAADEDSITLAVEAVRDLLAGREARDVDGLIFATTTSPYAEKQASALVATVADLRHDVRSIDHTSSLRAATSALGAALDTVAAGAGGRGGGSARHTRSPQWQRAWDSKPNRSPITCSLRSATAARRCRRSSCRPCLSRPRQAISCWSLVMDREPTRCCLK